MFWSMSYTKILIFLTCSILISGIASYRDYLDYSKFFFVIEMDSTASGLSQIFFDVGNGLQEQQSSSLRVRRSGFQKYYFPIPASFKSLRFDPINKPSVLRIKNAGIQNGAGSTLLQISIQSFKAKQQISESYIDKDEMRLRTIADNSSSMHSSPFI